MDIQLSDIWIAAGVIFGFQITWFSWRVSRETRMRSKGAPTWLPRADLMNLVSMIIMVSGVFISSLLSLNINIAKISFGLATILVVGHSFALAGHYELFRKGIKGKQDYYPCQEKMPSGLQ
jgi:hypothetical protein